MTTPENDPVRNHQDLIKRLKESAMYQGPDSELLDEAAAALQPTEQPVPVYATLIAQDVAFEHAKDENYLPQTKQEAMHWRPHAWVITAMLTYYQRRRDWETARDAALVPQPVAEAPAKNAGHGHVVPRPDGLRARCGGPALCRVCQREKAALAASPEAPQAPAQAAEPVAYRWRFTTANDKTWRHQAAYPHGFDPAIVECEPLVVAAPSSPQDAEAVSGWLPIESAPRDANVFMLDASNGAVGEAFFDSEESDCWVWADGRLVVEPSKWHPLPAAPKQGSEA